MFLSFSNLLDCACMSLSSNNNTENNDTKRKDTTFDTFKLKCVCEWVMAETKKVTKYKNSSRSKKREKKRGILEPTKAYIEISAIVYMYVSDGSSLYARDREPMKKNVTNSLRIHVFLIICVFLFFCFFLLVDLLLYGWWFSSCLASWLMIFSSSFLSFSFLPIPFEDCCRLIATQQSRAMRYRAYLILSLPHSISHFYKPHNTYYTLKDLNLILIKYFIC